MQGLSEADEKGKKRKRYFNTVTLTFVNLIFWDNSLNIMACRLFLRLNNVPALSNKVVDTTYQPVRNVSTRTIHLS